MYPRQNTTVGTQEGWVSLLKDGKYSQKLQLRTLCHYNIPTRFNDLGAKNMEIQQALMKDYLQLQNH